MLIQHLGMFFTKPTHLGRISSPPFRNIWKNRKASGSTQNSPRGLTELTSSKADDPSIALSLMALGFGDLLFQLGHRAKVA